MTVQRLGVGVGDTAVRGEVREDLPGRQSVTLTKEDGKRTREAVARA